MKKNSHILFNTVYSVSADGSVSERWLNTRYLFVYSPVLENSFIYGDSIETTLIPQKEQLMSFVDNYSDLFWFEYEKQVNVKFINPV